MTLIAVFLISFLPLNNPAPSDTVSLQYCQQMAKKNYPTAKNIALQKKITRLNVHIARSGYFPQVSVSGKATYQSEVTSVSLPGNQGPPPVSKDQYDASVNVTQKIFDDGRVGVQKALKRAQGAENIASTKVKMHQIRSQVNQVYYGILLSQQQAKILQLKTKNLLNQISSVRSKVKNGVLLPSQKYILQAELAQTRKDSANTHSNIIAGYQVLSELIGKKITPKTQLKIPSVAVNYRSLQPRRPEYQQFNKNQKILGEQIKLSETHKWPDVSVFGTGSYGRPGLNFLNNNFHFYYIVGLQLNWSLWGAFNGGRQAKALKIQQQKVTQDRKAFTRQLNAQLDQITQQIASIRDNMKRDRKIVKVRQKIVKQSASQLKNGVITATDYVTQLRQEEQAKLSLFISKVQLAQARTNYVTTLGIPIQKVNH
ncbi:MAG TPA: TolC family protein [Balneolaceae bacterium]|nr:TolC family protein [Balneolaceae bacterium]